MGGGKRRGMEEEGEAGGTSNSMTGLCDETQSNSEFFGLFKESVGLADLLSSLFSFSTVLSPHVSTPDI